MTQATLSRIRSLIKFATATRVTLSKDGRSWTFPSMEAASKYFSAISSFSPSQIHKMIMDRERYICGFYITYNE